MTLHQNCQGYSRRDCLQLGLGGLIGGGLVGALRASAATKSKTDASAEKKDRKRAPRQAKACILIWQDGGPSHYETFDPKPDAPSEIRGSFESFRTAIPGVHYSMHMKRLAKIADKTAIVRSIRHNQGNHGAGNHYMMTGAPPRIPVGCGAFVSFHPSMGSVISAELGAPHGMPAYFSMPRMSRSGGPNFLGAKYAPFVIADSPNSSGFRVRDVALPRGLSQDLYQDRQAIRKQIDQMKRINDAAAGDPANAHDDFYRQGHQIVTSKEAQRAFDIHKEPAKTRNKFGRNSFGQRALLARRLVEAGVPFVTLYEGGWDHHVDIFNALDKKLPPHEAGIAALIEDLDEREMLDDVLVIALGEFGRTPKINKRGGRDHWANAMSVMFAGGHTPGGQIVGATDRKGYSAAERVLSPENFVSTVYTKLGIDPDKIVYGPDGRPAHYVSDPEPISELMG
jgi:hypothetical protein